MQLYILMVDGDQVWVRGVVTFETGARTRAVFVSFVDKQGKQRLEPLSDIVEIGVK